MGRGPQRALSLSKRVSQKAVQLNGKQDMWELLKGTSSAASGVKMAPRYNSPSHLLRLTQEDCHV